MPPMQIGDIKGRLRVMRRSQADLARHLDIDPSSLVKTIKGERRVQAAEVIKIEAFFGERLELGNIGPSGQRRRPQVPAKVPVYGYAAAGGDDRIAFADDRVLDYLAPPPFWSGAGDLIYVRLLGDSMEPRYFSGEVLPVRLGVPPAKGQDCLVLFNDETAVVKTFQGRRDGKVYALQYNERRELAFEASSIQELHAIWRPGML